jgi:hypothetical protein
MQAASLAVHMHVCVFVVCLRCLQPKGGSTLLPAAGECGAIHVSSLATGRLVATLGRPDHQGAQQQDDSPKPCTALTGERAAAGTGHARHVMCMRLGVFC